MKIYVSKRDPWGKIYLYVQACVKYSLRLFLMLLVSKSGGSFLAIMI